MSQQLLQIVDGYLVSLISLPNYHMPFQATYPNISTLTLHPDRFTCISIFLVSRNRLSLIVP